MWENIATCMICHHVEVNISKHLWYFTFAACNFELFTCFLITALPKTFGARKMTWIHVFFLVVDMSYLFEEDETWHFSMRRIFKRVEITMETGFCFVDTVFFLCLCRLFCDWRSFLVACHLSNLKWWSKNMSARHSELSKIYFAHVEQFHFMW